MSQPNESRVGRDAVVRWLEGVGIQTSAAKVPDERDALFGELAVTIAGSTLCQKLVRTASYHMKRHDRSLRINIARGAEVHSGSVLAFARRLAGIGYLLDVNHRSGSLLVAELNRDDTDLRNAVLRFFDGGWLEHFALGTIRSVDSDLDVVSNVEVRRRNGRKAEFDVFALIAGQPIWIECKSGRYQHHVGRYADIRSELGLPAASSILVVRGIPKRAAVEASTALGLTVIAPDALCDVVTRRIVELRDGVTDHGPPDRDPDPDPSDVRDCCTAAELARLRKAKLDPLPELRRRVLAAILSSVRAEPGQHGLRELTGLAALDTGISRNRVGQIGRALRFAGMVLDSAGHVNTSFTDPVGNLRSGDIDELDAACRAVYTRVLAGDHPAASEAFDAIRTYRESDAA